MITLIEDYSSNKEETVKSTLDRLKFRKPLLKIDQTLGGESEL